MRLAAVTRGCLAPTRTGQQAATLLQGGFFPHPPVSAGARASVPADGPPTAPPPQVTLHFASRGPPQPEPLLSVRRAVRGDGSTQTRVRRAGPGQAWEVVTQVRRGAAAAAAAMPAWGAPTAAACGRRCLHAAPCLEHPKTAHPLPLGRRAGAAAGAPEAPQRPHRRRRQAGPLLRACPVGMRPTMFAPRSRGEAACPRRRARAPPLLAPKVRRDTEPTGAQLPGPAAAHRPAGGYARWGRAPRRAVAGEPPMQMGRVNAYSAGHPLAPSAPTQQGLDGAPAPGPRRRHRRPRRDDRGVRRPAGGGGEAAGGCRGRGGRVGRRAWKRGGPRRPGVRRDDPITAACFAHVPTGPFQTCYPHATNPC
jgi:hypothetical protein